MTVAPCPKSPNCVSTAADPADTKHYMAPIEYSVDTDAAIAAIERVIREHGGTVTATVEDGVDATFVTALMRFTDDVSFRLDEGAKLVHFRSASRTGHSDLGANRKRLEALIPAIRSHVQQGH